MLRFEKESLTVGAAAMTIVLGLVLLLPVPASAQVRGLEANVKVLEKAAQGSCPGCPPDDPRRLIGEAAAAIRITKGDAGDALLIQVIPLEFDALSVSELSVDGEAATFADGVWQVPRSAKMLKKVPKIEVTLDDGQALNFKPQHRPSQGPVGGLILPKNEEQPEANLYFHKKSFWADSLG